MSCLVSSNSGLELNQSGVIRSATLTNLRHGSMLFIVTGRRITVSGQSQHPKQTTGCAFLPDLKKSNWNTQGLFHSWYQEAHAEPLPLPFPQFPDSQPLLK